VIPIRAVAHLDPERHRVDIDGLGEAIGADAAPLPASQRAQPVRSEHSRRRADGDHGPTGSDRHQPYRHVVDDLPGYDVAQADSEGRKMGLALQVLDYHAWPLA
jgi:hypothetical protein